MAQATVTLSLQVDPAVLQIVTGSLTNAQVGASYNFQMNAVGGIAPYTWSATGLPAGLTISTGGLISGTPTTQGNSSVNFTVTDSE